MQNKDKGDGIEDSPLDMLLVILLDGASKEVVMPSSAANIYGNNRPPRQQYNHDLSSNKYNPDWKEYPSQKWGN